ncbi:MULTISPECIES: 50S ribosomal protein L22 [unclassified Spiroplasma]|uniref:50S ribosomal protein L22 n=1 Tax=unclassified Spiroplasma TaxID=2637901 RepID=UPI0030CB0BC1
MEAKAILRTIRIAPRKVQLIAELIRRKPVTDALAILMNTNKKASEPVLKLLKSAIANAVNNYAMDGDALLIKEVLVSEGATLKRFRPSDHGQAYKILKRTSHITIVVTDKKGGNQ